MAFEGVPMQVDHARQQVSAATIDPILAVLGGVGADGQDAAAGELDPGRFQPAVAGQDVDVVDQQVGDGVTGGCTARCKITSMPLGSMHSSVWLWPQCRIISVEPLS